MRVAFFGHNAFDAAVKRRILALQAGGAEVDGYTMRRGPPAPLPWRNVDLGETSDAAFAQRLRAIAGAGPRLAPYRAALRASDLWIARNLDMLAVAVAARRSCGASAPLIYECLDIHRLMTRTDPIGAAMRAAEAALIGQCAAILVSSPGFVREYFEPQHPKAAGKAIIVENRLPAGLALPPRPTAETRADPSAPLTIGWLGNLRCARTLRLLKASAERLGPRMRVHLHGYPSLVDIPDFDAQVAAAPGLAMFGRYRYPDDLAAAYGALDLVWAGDFHDARFNSRWLLPNRLYEGGYFGVPPVAPADSETGRWAAAKGLGFTLPEPLEETLPAFLETLDRNRLAAARAAVRAAPDDLFTAPVSEIMDVCAGVLSRARG